MGVLGHTPPSPGIFLDLQVLRHFELYQVFTRQTVNISKCMYHSQKELIHFEL